VFRQGQRAGHQSTLAADCFSASIARAMILVTWEFAEL
jgi:hypothetical protein